jgi:hypothetical protein
MKLYLTSIAVLLLAAATASAAPKWKGAGWYQLRGHLEYAPSIHAGPFDDDKACKATLPPDEAKYFYYCTHLTSRPYYD